MTGKLLPNWMLNLHAPPLLFLTPLRAQTTIRRETSHFYTELNSKWESLKKKKKKSTCFDAQRFWRWRFIIFCHTCKTAAFGVPLPFHKSSFRDINEALISRASHVLNTSPAAAFRRVSQPRREQSLILFFHLCFWLAARSYLILILITSIWRPPQPPPAFPANTKMFTLADWAGGAHRGSATGEHSMCAYVLWTDKELVSEVALKWTAAWEVETREAENCLVENCDLGTEDRKRSGIDTFRKQLKQKHPASLFEEKSLLSRSTSWKWWFPVKVSTAAAVENAAKVSSGNSSLKFTKVEIEFRRLTLDLTPPAEWEILWSFLFFLQMALEFCWTVHTGDNNLSATFKSCKVSSKEESLCR